MIDGIEKRVPLLPATTDIDYESENLTSRLYELVASPQVPRRPIRQELVESEDMDGTFRLSRDDLGRKCRRAVWTMERLLFQHDRLTRKLLNRL